MKVAYLNRVKVLFITTENLLLTGQETMWNISVQLVTCTRNNGQKILATNSVQFHLAEDVNRKLCYFQLSVCIKLALKAPLLISQLPMLNSHSDAFRPSSSPSSGLSPVYS